MQIKPFRLFAFSPKDLFPLPHETATRSRVAYFGWLVF